MILLNSEEELDEIFRETANRLKGHTKLDERALREIFDRTLAGAQYLTGRFAKWWTVMEEGEINVGSPAKAPYNLVIDRFGLVFTPMMWPGDKVAFESGLVPKALDDADEKAALNAFWNDILRGLRRDSILELAS